MQGYLQVFSLWYPGMQGFGRVATVGSEKGTANKKLGFFQYKGLDAES